MSNMSYCLFQSTLDDLKDCNEKLDEIEGNLNLLSEDEKIAAIKLIKLCDYIVKYNLGMIDDNH